MEAQPFTVSISVGVIPCGVDLDAQCVTYKGGRRSTCLFLYATLADVY